MVERDSGGGIRSISGCDAWDTKKLNDKNEKLIGKVLKRDIELW